MKSVPISNPKSLPQKKKRKEKKRKKKNPGYDYEKDLTFQENKSKVKKGPVLLILDLTGKKAMKQKI